jgi:hypothetical protein
MEALADLDVAEYGRHPAVDLWKRMAREALGRVWVEREGRFKALRTLNEVRALTTETNRMGKAALLDPLTGLGNRQIRFGEPVRPRSLGRGNRRPCPPAG